MSQTRGDWRSPRAIVHKRILDTAQDRPDASMHELADVITGASIDLVEKVLEEYGDPAEEPSTSKDAGQGQGMGESNTQPMNTEGSIDTENEPEMDELSEKQRETLRQIHEEPTASQREIAEVLGVSAATVSKRLNEIAGFTWENRQEFVAGLFEAEVLGDGIGQTEREPSTAMEDRLEQVEHQLHAIELATESPVLATELAHKVVHACMNSDQFSEDEELELIRTLFGNPKNTTQQ